MRAFASTFREYEYNVFLKKGTGSSNFSYVAVTRFPRFLSYSLKALREITNILNFIRIKLQYQPPYLKKDTCESGGKDLNQNHLFPEIFSHCFLEQNQKNTVFYFSNTQSPWYKT